MNEQYIIQDSIDVWGNFLTEDVKKESEEQMKKFFPSIWNSLKGNFQILVPLTTTKLTKETAIMKKYIKGLEFEVRLNHSPSRNAYTYPSVKTTGGAQLMSIPIFGALMYTAAGLAYVGKSKLLQRARSMDGIVMFPRSDLRVLAFETKGLLTDLDETERVAVMLHEIGHWAKINPVIGRVAISLFDLPARIASEVIPALAPLGFAISICFNLVSRSAEKQADLFAKQMGYGNELASALDRILLRPRTDVSWFNSLGDWITKIIMTIQNIFDQVFPFLYSYPSAEKRKTYLTQEQLHLEMQAVNENIMNITMKLLLPICHKLDKKIAPNLKTMFPVK